MSVKVNPPPQIRIPEEFFSKPDLRNFFERKQQILFQLWNRTGGSTDLIAGIIAPEVVNVTDTDITLAEFGIIVVVNATNKDVTVTLPIITADDIGKGITVIAEDATNNCIVSTDGVATVLGDTSVIMNCNFMSFDFAAISTSKWVAE